MIGCEKGNSAYGCGVDEIPELSQIRDGEMEGNGGEEEKDDLAGCSLCGAALFDMGRVFLDDS